MVPRCKGGTEIVPTCHSCEDFIHQTWSHNELRDEFNTVEKILADAVGPPAHLEHTSLIREIAGVFPGGARFKVVGVR